MARLPRLELPSVPLHVVQRGNNRAACFHADADRRLYLRYLAEAARRHGCAIHAYVLMPNHVHLLMSPLAAGAVARTMQDVGRRYVRRFNETYKRSGTLWEGRYKAHLVDSETYLFVCHRYIELNPVRAGMVEHPLQFPWSSHAHYALGAESRLITRHALFESLAGDESARRAAFLAQFRESMAADKVERIRTAVNQGRALGSDSFLDRVGAALGRSVRTPKRGRPFRENGSIMLI
jgi:putative transposase